MGLNILNDHYKIQNYGVVSTQSESSSKDNANKRQFISNGTATLGASFQLLGDIQDNEKVFITGLSLSALSNTAGSIALSQIEIQTAPGSAIVLDSLPLIVDNIVNSKFCITHTISFLMPIRIDPKQSVYLTVDSANVTALGFLYGWIETN